jgi:hypothetical protein
LFAIVFRVRVSIDRQGQPLRDGAGQRARREERAVAGERDDVRRRRRDGDGIESPREREEARRAGGGAVKARERRGVHASAREPREPVRGLADV